MKQSTRVATFLMLVALSTGCTLSLPSIRMKSDQMHGMPMNATAACYTNTYFQARFMGLKPLISPMLWFAVGSVQDRKSQRLQSNEFEKLLADFDVFEYFNKQLKQRAGDSGIVRLKFSDSATLTPKIIEFAQCDHKDDCMTAVKSLGEATPYIAALKMSYGLGTRQGNDQLGFTKSYRPFIRVIGVVKKVSSAEVMWQSDVLVFGDKPYKGGDAEADRIPRAELVSAFKVLTTQAIDLVVRSLNGEVLQEMPVLSDTTSSDLKF